MTAWGSQAILAAALLTAFNAVLLVALLRRLRPIQDALLVGAVVPDQSLPGPGTRIGRFAVDTLDGQTLDEQIVGQGRIWSASSPSMCLACEAERVRLLERRLDLPLLSFVYNGDYHDKALALALLLEPLGPAAFLRAGRTSVLASPRVGLSDADARGARRDPRGGALD